MACTPPEGRGLGIHRILVDVREQVGIQPGGSGGLDPCLIGARQGLLSYPAASPFRAERGGAGKVTGRPGSWCQCVEEESGALACP